VSLLVGLPVAWLLMERFLGTFTFHVELGPSVFIATIAAMFFVAIITVSFQSLKAALSNPVNALKNE
jgi:putative ABC transport system permease protein